MTGSQNTQSLEQAILDAHHRNDTFVLASLYRKAADIKKSDGDVEAYWFLLTHAYVFALESGHHDMARLRNKLVAGGRDE